VNSPTAVWTIGALLDWTAKFLSEKGCEFPRLDAEVLLAHALGCRRIELYTRHAETASDEVRERFRGLVRRRIEGCPVAYLVGRKEFFALEFEVGPAVLIPRPESEFVVMECLRLAKPMTSPRVLDIGTGSGNIAIAIAHRHKGVTVIGIDQSREALELAKRNGQRLGVSGRVTFSYSDMFTSLADVETFDFVVSNPPYIPHNDIPNLPPGVRDYEPHLALDGGADGFEAFDRLVKEAPRRLVPGGYLIVEIGAPQETHARQKIMSIPGYQLAPTINDYSGHPRVLQARWQPE
jgi:release factor glutamine methyltransferase